MSPPHAFNVRASAEPAGDTATLEREETQTAVDKPWNVIVWNDPVNLMSYVAYVFRRHFGYSEAHAQKLMLEVHHHGRSAVASGSKEEAERHVQAMHSYGLWATMEQTD